jgi:tRNA (uracil-5-)-methyltransferase TRM9
MPSCRLLAYNWTMKAETAIKILTLNHQFYQSFAEDFSATRQRLQPGVLNLLDRFLAAESILDLGCGNGELARELIKSEYKGIYHGTDFSTILIENAGQDLPPGERIRFFELNLVLSSWENILPAASYDMILCLASLHHIPGAQERMRVIKNIRKHISNQGLFFLSNWQFLRSERFKDRILPWSSAGIQENEVDDGDYLLDWRRGGLGMRYVHHFSEEELAGLADEGGFTIQESFLSDGKEGNLSIYQVWEPV